MNTENVWKQLVTAAAQPAAIGSDRGRRTLLSEAMTLGTTITEDSVGCSITQAVGSDFRTYVSSGSLALDLDSAQYADDDGPCLAACRDGQVHSITVMADESSYAEFTKLALSRDVRSSLSLPLPDVTRASSLNLYARSPSAYTAPHARAVAALLARCAAAILTADPFATQSPPVAPPHGDPEPDLQAAADAETVAAALRLLRAHDGLDDPAAFAELTRRSRANGAGLVTVAHALVRERTGLGG